MLMFSLSLNEGNYCLTIFCYYEHSWSKYIKTFRTSAWYAFSGMKELDIVIKRGGARRRQVEGGTKVMFLLFRLEGDGTKSVRVGGVKTKAKQARVEVISICDAGPEPT